MRNRRNRKVTWTPTRIKALRERYGETQSEFCKRLRLSLPALKWWEQGRGSPNGPAELLLDRLDEDLRDGKVRQLQIA